MGIACATHSLVQIVDLDQKVVRAEHGGRNLGIRVFAQALNLVLLVVQALRHVRGGSQQRGLAFGQVGAAGGIDERAFEAGVEARERGPILGRADDVLDPGAIGVQRVGVGMVGTDVPPFGDHRLVPVPGDAEDLDTAQGAWRRLDAAAGIARDQRVGDVVRGDRGLPRGRGQAAERICEG